MTRKVVLDTDMASDVDDALCLALALASPELELLALTHVGNESVLRAQVSKKLLELAGRDEIPCYAGCRVPVMDVGRFNWFGHEGQGILEPGEQPEIEREHAVDALCRILREHDDVHVVAVGPMTNLAVALLKDPDLALRIASLTIMGGHIRDVAYGGQTFEPGLDYNLCSDPQASVNVLRAGMPIRLVTADVTLRSWIEASDLAAIESAGTRFHSVLAEAVRIWTPVQKRLFSRAGCDTDDGNVAFLHDPLALACLYDEGFCSFEDLEIEPVIQEGVFRTLERETASDETRPMRCALDVDAARFGRHFVERVTSLKA